MLTKYKEEHVDKEDDENLGVFLISASLVILIGALMINAFGTVAGLISILVGIVELSNYIF